jgi:GrpB-like predicted nucleotidyltransferase (UPF0157 family)
MKLVHLEAYNNQWMDLYEKDKEIIVAVLGEHCIEIEHVGSTSIPDMWAKPLIDIAVMVASFRIIDEDIIRNLKQIGYEFVHKEEFQTRRFFRKGAWGIWDTPSSYL